MARNSDSNKRTFRTLDDVKKEEILRLRSEGWGTRYIAKAVGVNRSTIQAYYELVGLKNIDPPAKAKPTKRQCKECSVIKSISEFSTYNKVMKGKKYNVIRVYCFTCEEIINRKLYEAQYERQKAAGWHANYRKKNRDKINKYQNEYTKEYTKERKKRDPKFKLRIMFSTAIGNALRKKEGRKRSSIMDFLSYTIQELKEHLQSQFEPWMTWENWGMYRAKDWDDNDQSTWKWQIDHILPEDSFNYNSMADEEFQKCWALDNLRPLSAKANLLKSNKIE